MKKNIKVLPKRAKALFLTYVLVLGSFSSVAPFLFAQKVGAEVPDPLYVLQVSPDSPYGVVGNPGEPIFFRAKVTTSGDLDTPVSIMEGFGDKAYLIGDYDGGSKGKIIKAPKGSVDCGSVDMTAKIGKQVDFYSGDSVEASFCYLPPVGCVSSLLFIAKFPKNSLVGVEDDQGIRYDKDILILTRGIDLGIDIKMTVDIPNDNIIDFSWNEAKNSQGIPANKYVLEVIYYDGLFGNKIVYSSGEISDNTFKHRYTTNAEEGGGLVQDGDYGWCVVASFEDVGDNKYCSPIQRFNKTKPAITLKGDSVVNIEFGEEYNDAGATAYGIIDGDLTDKITIGGNVDTNKLGRYVISYDVTDNSDKKAKTLERIVNVVPRKVTVKIKDLSKIFGESDPVFEYQIVKGGLLEGDDLGLEIKRLGLEEVGLYNITGTASLSLNPNYYVLILPGIFTITEKPAEVTVEPEIIETVAAVTPTTYYDRVGVVDTGEQESAGTVETKEEIKAKKEEVKKTWKILGAAWYWWILITAVLGALSWWFSPVKPAKDGKDTTNSSDK